MFRLPNLAAAVSRPFSGFPTPSRPRYLSSLAIFIPLKSLICANCALELSATLQGRPEGRRPFWAANRLGGGAASIEAKSSFTSLFCTSARKVGLDLPGDTSDRLWLLCNVLPRGVCSHPQYPTFSFARKISGCLFFCPPTPFHPCWPPTG